ncbi:hypothetical protein AB0B03_11315 [Micromonospora chalcea]
MSRVQLALRVSDLEGSVAFYSKLFGVEPANTDEVNAATNRLTESGLITLEEVWVRGPGDEPWEVGSPPPSEPGTARSSPAGAPVRIAVVRRSSGTEIPHDPGG